MLSYLTMVTGSSSSLLHRTVLATSLLLGTNFSILGRILTNVNILEHTQQTFYTILAAGIKTYRPHVFISPGSGPSMLKCIPFIRVFADLFSSYHLFWFLGFSFVGRHHSFARHFPIYEFVSGAPSSDPCAEYADFLIVLLLVCFLVYAMLSF